MNPDAAHKFGISRFTLNLYKKRVKTSMRIRWAFQRVALTHPRLSHCLTYQSAVRMAILWTCLGCLVHNLRIISRYRRRCATLH